MVAAFVMFEDGDEGRQMQDRKAPEVGEDLVDTASATPIRSCRF